MIQDVVVISKIAIFKGTQIRKIINNNEWWFSVVDICQVLTDSPDAGAYWRKLKQRLTEEGSEVVTFCHGLNTDAQGFASNKIAAVKGGTIAGDARKKLEVESGKKVSTGENYLREGQKIKSLKGKSK